ALAAFDWINMMIYDRTGPFNPANPGQHAPYWWTEDCVQYWLDQNVPAQKLTLGVPFYGYDFGVSPVEALTYRYIVSLNTANAQLDQVNDTYYNGIPTIKAKTQLALDQVAGVMIWEIGQDAFGTNQTYSLLRAIDELVNPITETQEVAQSSLRLFPNPVGEVLTVAMESGIAGTILIRDVQGKLVQSVETNGETQVQIPTAALPAGFYVLVFNNLEKIQSTKFIKQ
ncbi:MAG: glycosyl hydrolase family 18 protein, partial [Saprospiraceae bacterium]